MVPDIWTMSTDSIAIRHQSFRSIAVMVLARRSLDQAHRMVGTEVLYNDSFKWLDCFAETAMA
jgi:hypothetical protein